MDIKKINPVSFQKEALLAAQNSGGLYTADRLARIFKYVSHVPAFIAIVVSGLLLAYSFAANISIASGIMAVIATSVFWAGALMLSFTGVISGLTRDKILEKPYKRLTRGLLLNNERRSHRETPSSAVVCVNNAVTTLSDGGIPRRTVTSGSSQPRSCGCKYHKRTAGHYNRRNHG